MKIRQLQIFQCDLPLHEGAYHWAGGKSVAVFDSTVVMVETDSGITGWGEICPLGAHYLPSYAAGARAGIAEIAPRLIGEDPQGIDLLNRKMDSWLKGHPYVKSAIDMACWDVLGQASGQAVATLLGGIDGASIKLYRAISQESPQAMAAKVADYRAEGYRCFQIKVGGDADLDIERIHAVAEKLKPGDVLVADANTGWLPHQAMRVIHAIKDVEVYVEQPCATYEECLSVRKHSDHPFILDECMDSIAAVVRACVDGAMDVVNIKISRFGGLSRARLLRDFLCAQGVALTIEDSWGSDIVTAAIAHLAHSTPEENRFTSTDFNSYVTVHTAEGAPQRKNGTMRASAKSGLGIKPVEKLFKTPTLAFS